MVWIYVNTNHQVGHPDHRAHILGRDGKIVEAVDFISDDDEAAKKHMKGLSGGNDVELRQGKRCVESSRVRPPQ